VKADASDYAMEEVLSVKYKNGKWRPIAFISKLMNLTKRNYEIHNKEMLAVIGVWKHGGIIWKRQRCSLKYEWTIRIYNTLCLAKS